MKYYYYLIALLFLIISCKTSTTVSKSENINVNVNFNEGWFNESKFVVTSIGYPNGYSANKDESKESAYNAALNLSKVKIENAFIKEIPNKRYENSDLKNIIDKYMKVEYAKFVDDRYYQIKTAIEYKDLLNILREGDISILLK